MNDSFNIRVAIYTEFTDLPLNARSFRIAYDPRNLKIQALLDGIKLDYNMWDNDMSNVDMEHLSRYVKIDIDDFSIYVEQFEHWKKISPDEIKKMFEEQLANPRYPLDGSECEPYIGHIDGVKFIAKTISVDDLRGHHIIVSYDEDDYAAWRAVDIMMGDNDFGCETINNLPFSALNKFVRIDFGEFSLSVLVDENDKSMIPVEKFKEMMQESMAVNKFFIGDPDDEHLAQTIKYAQDLLEYVNEYSDNVRFEVRGFTECCPECCDNDCEDCNLKED